MSIELASLSATSFPAVVVFVDCQEDFVLPTGKLYIPGAEKTILGLQALLNGVKPNPNVIKLFTLDTHDENYASSPEAAEFPPHCIDGTPGHQLVLDTSNCAQDYYLRKGVFDMWAQNPLVKGGADNPTYQYTVEECVDNLHRLWFHDNQEPLIHVVGHALNYCVKYAIEGFIRHGFHVRLFSDLSTGIKLPDGSGLDAHDVYRQHVQSGHMTISRLFD